MEVLPQK